MPWRHTLSILALGALSSFAGFDGRAEDAVAPPQEPADEATVSPPADVPPGLELEPATEAMLPGGALESFMESLALAGYQISPEVAEQAMLKGLIESIDPYAKLLDVSDLEDFEAELAEQESGVVPEGVTNGAAHLYRAGITDIELYGTGHLYIRLSGIHTNTGAVLADKLVEYGDGPHGLVLDLRGASGRSEYQVLRIASFFPRDMPLAFLVDYYNGRREEMLVPASMPVWTKAVAVLIDGETSGAAEALAAALSHARSVLIIGTASRGDGRLRGLVKVSAERFVYMATRRILLPNGADYAGIGILPDITLDTAEMAPHEVTPVKDFDDRPRSERVDKIRDVMLQTGSDPTVQRAISILIGLHALGKSGDEPDHASRD
ncbi:MAG: S41 family peptidase [Verrucomicrobia bacterium]|nr:S41 family peptidase [Verrucomicrobiota bacterium]MDA1088411.1 S41 family peptidase [Verrucomicrobiota bacterium]